MSECVLKKVPFSWNDNFSEIALEDFEQVQKSLPYCASQTIGMALAKLELLENGRRDAEMNEHFNELTESQKKAINDVIEAMWENNKSKEEKDEASSINNNSRGSGN